MLAPFLPMAFFLGYVHEGNWRTMVVIHRFFGRSVCHLVNCEMWNTTWPSACVLFALAKTTKIATWLILPVVIRSSQRLSHACLSINILLWNCEWLIISVIVYLVVPYYLDTRSNSRANTCINTRLLEEWYLLDWNQPLRGDVVIHNKLADRMPLAAMDHSSFCPISFGW